MKLSEYLEIKANTTAKYITRFEANLIGFGWPPPKGWAKQLKNLELPNDMSVTLMNYLSNLVASKVISSDNKGQTISKRKLKAINRKQAKLYKQSKNIYEYNKLPPKQYIGPYIDPNSEDFLNSYQWRTLRMDTLVKYGNVCMCCGNHPKNGAIINVDHIKPRKTHPHLALDINNLQILCSVCNHGKSNRHSTDWREEIINCDDVENFDPMNGLNEMLKSF